MDLKDYIRDIPDFPRPGVLFKDITPLLKDTSAFQKAIDSFAQRCSHLDFSAIVGIESRGFLFAAPLARDLRKRLIPVRKEGKLPAETFAHEYKLEYGDSVVELHRDAIEKGERVLIVDDLLATGGTITATASLVEKAGGTVSGVAVLIELSSLRGGDVLTDYEVISLIRY